MFRPILLLSLLSLPLAADTSGRRGAADPALFKERVSYEGRHRIWMVSPGGRWVTSKTGSAVTILDARTGRKHGVLKGHSASLHDAGWSRNGRTLATAGYDGSVKVWDVPTLREVASVPAHSGYSCSCAVSYDGRILAAGGSSEATLKLYSIPEGKQLASVDCGGGAVYLCEFNPKATHVVVSTGDNALKAVEVATGRVTVIQENIGYVPNIDFSPDGKRMCGPAAGTIVVWDARAWKEERRLETEQPRSCLGTFSEDGRTLAVSSTDGTLQLWNLQTGKVTATLSNEIHGITKMRFSADGRSLVSAGPTVQVRVFGLPGDRFAEPKPDTDGEGPIEGEDD